MCIKVPKIRVNRVLQKNKKADFSAGYRLLHPCTLQISPLALQQLKCAVQIWKESVGNRSEFCTSCKCSITASGDLGIGTQSLLGSYRTFYYTAIPLQCFMYGAGGAAVACQYRAGYSYGVSEEGGVNRDVRTVHPGAAQVDNSNLPVTPPPPHASLCLFADRYIVFCRKCHVDF